MVKGVFSLYSCLKWSEIVWQQWEIHFFGASSRRGRTFYFVPLRPYLYVKYTKTIMENSTSFTHTRN